MNVQAVARAVHGEVTGRDSVLCPGPAHSPRDRSLSIKLDVNAPDGFVVYSHAGDDPIECRDHVRALVGLGPWRPSHREKPKAIFKPAAVEKKPEIIAPDPVAIRVWNESNDPRGTVVEQYLVARGLELPDDVAGRVLRHHPRLSFGDGQFTAGMLALFRDIRTDEPRAIHRTFLDAAGCKVARKMLGPVKGAAIKLDDDADVTLGLHIGEGIETGLAARLAGFRPAWALGSAGAIASFPVLNGIDAVTVLGETDDSGANAKAAKECAARWIAEGREVYVAEPRAGDLNDVWREAVR